jgi:alpha-glucosidase
MGEVNSENYVWWKHGVVYNLYVRSFKDSNHDGIGDLRGIIQRFDYLVQLGIKAIWLSPIYESPMKDYGYDIVNYRAIDPSYGTMEDFKELLALSHAKDIKIVMDMVMNHTSNEHPWFVESSSSLDNPKRDWYIWKNNCNGKSPTNWRSAFGGSAWEWDESTQQYYLHSFLKDQPDLNWRNKELHNAFFDEIRFWLDLGVDGFRLDVINYIVKDEKFRDNPFIKWGRPTKDRLYSRNRGSSIKIVRKLRQLLDTYEDKMLVGEIYTPPPGNNATVINYLGEGDNALHLAFDFSLIFRFWNAKKYYKCIETWENNLPEKAWPSYVLSNHDLLRSYNRLGIGRHKLEKAHIASILLITLRGTPFVYYGEEIGMQNQKIRRKHIKDPLGKKYWPFFSGRDKSRTPMQWSAETFGGFSSVKPWLPINRNFYRVNVEEQENDSNSLLTHYRTLIKLRNSYIALSHGNLRFLQQGENGVLGYTRMHETQEIYILLNFNNTKRTISIPNDESWQILYSTHSHNDKTCQDFIDLDKFEGLVLLKME